MRKAPRNPEPGKQWKVFLNNHREAIAAMDFFTVPTLAFGVLYCFFVIAHNRRRILHFNVDEAPHQHLGGSAASRGLSLRLGTRLSHL